MPRQNVAKTASVGRYPLAAGGAVLAWTAADTSNHEQVTMTGDEVFLVHNTGATSHTYTITSTADPYGRTGDISGVTIAAGAIHGIGPLGIEGWRQTDGKLYFQANHAEVKWAVYTP